MLKKLALCIREYKVPTLLTLLFIIGEALIETFIPFITANLVNRIKMGAEMEFVLKTGGLLVLLAFLSLGCGAVAGITASRASAGFAKNIRSDIFAQVQKFSFGNIDRFASSSLVTRMTTDVSNVQISYMMLIRTAIRSPLMLIFSMVMACYMGGKLGLTFVVVVPVLGLGLFFVSQKAMPAFRRVFRKYDRLNESIEENVRGMRVVKGFSRESYEIKKFDTAAKDICNDFTKAERIVALNSPLMQFCVYFNMVFIMLLGSKLAITTSGAAVDVGQISAMLTYGFQVLMALMMLSMIYVMLTMSAESAKRICEVLEESPTITNPKNAETTVADGSVSFKNVSFKYSEKAKKDSLRNINLDIASGMTVGIIGGTGSGKTSLTQLIPRLYDVTEGCITVGGKDVRTYDLDTLRSACSMVLQKNELFSGTIAENLRWGNADATDEELRHACHLACADEFIDTFPEGYETKIEQGGANVSGGQKQRLCIARALLKKPKILILDDSTSAVDTKTDAKIRAGFAEYIPETTKIIIAQRISSIEHSDLIVVMDDGTIVATGTHETLLRDCEIYRDVYENQANGGDENNA